MRVHSASTYILLYDGDCPLCSRAADYYRLKSALPGFQLVSMRDHAALASLQLSQELALEKGMILLNPDGSALQGEQALAALSDALSGTSKPQSSVERAWQSAWRTIIRCRPLRLLVYAAAKCARRISLFFLGKSERIYRPPNNLE